MQKNCQFASTVCIAFEFASSGSCTVNIGPNTTNEVPNLALEYYLSLGEVRIVKIFLSILKFIDNNFLKKIPGDRRSRVIN